MMADKEERIIFLITKPKGTCPGQIDKDYCKETCWVKGKCSLGISRSEAIDKIAKAVFEKDNVLSLDFNVEEANQKIRKFYKEIAEAALNALLEDKK